MLPEAIRERLQDGQRVGLVLCRTPYGNTHSGITFAWAGQLYLYHQAFHYQTRVEPFDDEIAEVGGSSLVVAVPYPPARQRAIAGFPNSLRLVDPQYPYSLRYDPEAVIDPVLGRLVTDTGLGLSCVTFVLDRKRFNVVAFWPRRDADLDGHWTEALTQLVEPHLQARRRLPGFRDSRDRPFSQADMEEVRHCRECGAAHSFRVFARRWLTALAQTSATIPPPPDGDEAFAAYLADVFATAKRLGDGRAIYFAAVGRAAFGDATAIDAILDHLPRESSWVWDQPLWAGQFLGLILPNDASQCPVAETDALRGRLRERERPLRWYAEGEFFS